MKEKSDSFSASAASFIMSMLVREIAVYNNVESYGCTPHICGV